jgi:hypothetical protein
MIGCIDPISASSSTDRMEWRSCPRVTPEQSKGFGLFALKAVLSRHDDKFIDLAETSLWR